MRTLKEVNIGETVTVVKVTGEGPVKRRIMDMGITKGTDIYVRKVAPLGDPIEVMVRGYELSLRKADVERIQVEKQSVAAAHRELTQMKDDKEPLVKSNKPIRIALAGNPNSGKTTLFNALTGSNQFGGNWPGVTVEKKEGKLKKRDDVIVTDLPGIYSLSPYTLEEVVARKYLLDEEPEAILNIIDGTNLERNLYLTTQLAELGIPMVIAVNMMDIVRKNGDRIDFEELSRELGCKVMEISALNNDGVMAAAEEAIKAAKRLRPLPMHTFSGPVEHAIAHIEEAVLHDMPSERQRWYAIKIFERDEKVLAKLGIPADKLQHIEQDIVAAEKELDDDAESLIISERYNYIAELLKGSYHKANAGGLTTSDKIDKIVTSRILGLPILAAVMFLVYYIAMVAVGQKASEWANDGLFGDGFHLFGVGTSKYEAKLEAFTDAKHAVDAFVTKEKAADVAAKLNPAAEDFDAQVAKTALADYSATVPNDAKAVLEIVNEEDLSVENVEFTGEDLKNALLVMDQFGFTEPDPAADGWWISGVPVVIGDMLDKMNCSKWLRGLVIGGIVAGVGAVLGFVPQIFVLFLLLAFLEACGYMSRIAFVLDRLFRKFGLSGKSFIPILVGTGCGVPGIMASRTIESERDRRMTIITTTFIPCGAKTPFIALIAGAIFGGSPWIATSAYFLGLSCIVCSGIILKKTKMFAGEPSPFVMELPPYHMPLMSNVLRSMWDRGWSFIKKAGTIILLCTVLVWLMTYFGFTEDGFRMLGDDEIDRSLLATLGKGIAWIFAPLGWGHWQTAVASITGLVAKENIVGTLGILYQNGAASSARANLALALNGWAGYSFLAFNLLCAPCFAAMAAIRREMNSARWTAFAIGYQCLLAYVVSLTIYQIGSAIHGELHAIGLVAAIIVDVAALYMLFRPYKEATKLTTID